MHVASTCLTRQGNTWVRGFPSVLYGTDQCHADTSPTPSPDSSFRCRVDAIPAISSATPPTTPQGAQVTYDVAYDLWLSPSDTKTPCQSDGTVEVMIWTDYADAGAAARQPQGRHDDDPLLGQRSSSSPATQAWSVYANNIYGGGHTVPWGGTVWLVLDRPTSRSSRAR